MGLRLAIIPVIVSLLSVTAGCASTTDADEPLSEAENRPDNGGSNKHTPEMNSNQHLTTSNTLADLIGHPAFEGFGRYILPLEWGYDPGMKLSDIQSLLPYHNYVDAERAVGYINEMIDMRKRGDRLFYDLSRKDAGLFFFPGNPGAPFAVFCPGGGFSYVGSIHEGFPLALELSKKGYNAFVIQYSVERGAQSAVEDLSDAWNRCRVPFVSQFTPRIRPWCRNKCTRLDGRSCRVLGKTYGSSLRTGRYNN